MPGFAHLHVHSDLSVGKGVSSMRSLVDRAASLDMKALALTDDRLMNISAFLSYAREKGIKPIAGLETIVLTGSSIAPLGHLVLLAANAEGFDNLKHISSASFAGRKNGQEPLVTMTILERHHKGIIALSGYRHGVISSLIAMGRSDAATGRARVFEDIFDGAFYYEIARYGAPMQTEINEKLVEMAPKGRIVAANNVYFASEDDIGTHLLVSRLGPDREPAGEQWLKSESEMTRLFSDMPEAIEKSVEIADMCEDLSLVQEKKRVFMPKGPEDADLLREKVFSALERSGFQENGEYVNRIEKELDLIDRCGFTKRLLVIADLMEHAHEKGILTGIGRGSACESLVCYLLGITKVNPMKWDGLFFERFMNPERVSMPDIDIDVDAERRQELVAYIREKYGEKHVAGIPVISTYKGRSAIRAAAGILASEGVEIPEKRLLSLSATVEKMQARTGKSLAALLEDGTFDYYAGDARKLYDCLSYAAKLENLPGGFGLHPSGVLVSEHMEDNATMLLKGGHVVIQRDAGELEKDTSFFKIDLLSSNALCILKHTLENIKKQGKPVPDINHLPLYNEKAYEFYAKGDGICIFQMEGETAKESAVRIQPRNFWELVAWTAITRPGAQKILESYVARGKGKEAVSWYGLGEQLRPILKETRGLVLYQEQIMQIALNVAGYDLARADSLQHAVSKKNPDELKAHRESFVSGAVAGGVRKDAAERLFSALENFTGYGFNKAHAIAYAYTSYITAWLKAEYPAEFLLANLEYGAKNPVKHAQRIEWASAHGILSLPDILASEKETEIRDGKILLGLSSIRGISEKAVDDLLALRKTWHEDEPSDLSDFLSRSPAFNKSFLASLTGAGAIDAFIGGADKRPIVMKNLDAIVASAAKKRMGHAAGFEKDMRFPFLGIEKIGEEEFFAGVRKEIVDSGNRVRIGEIGEKTWTPESYALVKIEDFAAGKNGDFHCTLRDDSGEIPVTISASDWEGMRSQANRKEPFALEEGRHELPIAVDMEKAFREGKLFFQVGLEKDGDGYHIRSADVLKKRLSCTLVRFPASCDVREAEESLDILAAKFACDGPDGEVYYIDYGNRMPPRALFLKETQEARDAVERWRGKAGCPSLHNKPM